MKTKQTNIRLEAGLRQWYDDLGEREERDAAFFMRKALEQYRDGFDVKPVKSSAPEKSKFCFKTEMLNIGVNKDVLDDWMKVRANKKAANTKTAFNGLLNKFKASGLTPNACVTISAQNSWKGFDSAWINNHYGKQSPPNDQSGFLKGGAKNDNYIDGEVIRE